MSLYEEKSFNTENTEVKKRITFDDVKNALTTDDDNEILPTPVSPFNTNSAKIRAKLGYGSNATIQKHLETMRDEINKKRISETSNAETETPKIPKDLTQNLWETAYSAAQIYTLSRLEKLTVEKESLQLLVETQKNDIESFTDTNDKLNDEILKLNKEIKKSTDALDNAKNVAFEENKEKIEELEAKNRDFELLKKELELERKNSELIKMTMQTTIDHLTNQISELKAMRVVQRPRVQEQSNRQ